jgi:hypothetical protein
MENRATSNDRRTHPSGAEAHVYLINLCGTAEAVPFQSPTFTEGCQSHLPKAHLPSMEMIFDV